MNKLQMNFQLNIQRLAPQTVSLSKRFGLMAGCLAGLTLILLGGDYFMSTMLTEYDQTVQRVTSLTSNINGLNNTIKTQEERLMAIGGLSNNVITRDSFVTFLGTSAEAADIEIVSLTGGDTLDAGSVLAVNFKFELHGRVSNMWQLIESIDSLQAPYNIRAMSLRKDGKYLWLDRNSTQVDPLDWLEMGSSAIPQQSIPMPEALPEIVLNSKGEIVEIHDDRLIGLRSLLDGDSINLYLDLSFLIRSDAGAGPEE